jgi:hypothetical protein
VETAVKGMRSGTGQPGLRSGFNPIWIQLCDQSLHSSNCDTHRMVRLKWMS